MNWETALWALAAISGCNVLMTLTARGWRDKPSNGRIMRYTILGVVLSVVYMIALGAIAEPSSTALGGIALIFLAVAFSVKGKARSATVSE